MATKISALASYSSEAGNDLIPIVDVSDTSMAASGTDKAATVYQVFGSPSATGQLVYWNGTSTGVPAGASHLIVGAGGQLNFDPIAAPGSPVDGDLWYDSTQLAHSFQRKGMAAAGVGLLFSQVTNVTVTTNSATTLLSSTSAYGTLSLPAGFLNVQGKTIRILGGGYFSSSASPGNMSMGLKLGSNVVATNTNAGVVASITNKGFRFELTVTTKVAGASGKLDSYGAIHFYNSANTTLALYFNNGTTIGTTAPGTQVTLDLTAAYAIDWQILLSVTTNTFTLTNFTVEALN